MIAAVTDLAGNITGAQRTWLAPDGTGKAPIPDPDPPDPAGAPAPAAGFAGGSFGAGIVVIGWRSTARHVRPDCALDGELLYSTTPFAPSQR